jgi:hypothetical protein
MKEELKEFNPGFDFDIQDLESLGIGSGVHAEKDVSINLFIVDRKGEELNNIGLISKSKYCESIIFDIADVSGNVIVENYQSGSSPSLTITETENQSIFGEYKKDFGIYSRVIDSTSPIVFSGFTSIYGNNLQISGIEAVDSSGIHRYEEPVSVHLKAMLEPSGYIYSGEMQELNTVTRFPTHYTLTGERQIDSGNYQWEASLFWEFNNNYFSGNPSYSQDSYEIESFEGEGYWTLVLNDFYPSGSFLISKGSSDPSNPYGSYIDDLGSGFINRYSKEPNINQEIKTEDNEIAVSISYQNKEVFTKFSHTNVYSFYGEELKREQFEFLEMFTGQNMYKASIGQDLNLQSNEPLWLKFEPYSVLGQGDSWIVGPLKNTELNEQESVTETNQIDIKDGFSSANINFKQRDITEVLEGNSGVIDRLYAYKEYGEQKQIYESNEGLNFDYYTVPTNDSGVWQNTTFDYLIEFKSNQNAYNVSDIKVRLSASGVSTNPINEGMPLFRLTKESTNDIEVALKYSESGVSLLCSTGNGFDSYKYYKTSL